MKSVREGVSAEMENDYAVSRYPDGKAAGKQRKRQRHRPIVPSPIRFSGRVKSRHVVSGGYRVERLRVWGFSTPQAHVGSWGWEAAGRSDRLFGAERADSLSNLPLEASRVSTFYSSVSAAGQRAKGKDFSTYTPQCANGLIGVKGMTEWMGLKNDLLRFISLARSPKPFFFNCINPNFRVLGFL